MSKFSENGKEFRFDVETDERNFNVVVMYVDGVKVDDEYVSLGNSTCDMENVAAVERVLMERNGYTEPEEVVCPVCGAAHKEYASGKKGWWVYTTGKWACDECGSEGTVWYQGDDVSSLSVEE